MIKTYEDVVEHLDHIIIIMEEMHGENMDISTLKHLQSYLGLVILDNDRFALKALRRFNQVSIDLLDSGKYTAEIILLRQLYREFRKIVEKNKKVLDL